VITLALLSMGFVAVMLLLCFGLTACEPSHRPGTVPGRNVHTIPAPGPNGGPTIEFEPGEPSW
jgi:hypothetical protein